MSGIQIITDKILGEAGQFESERFAEAKTEADKMIEAASLKCREIESETNEKIERLTAQYDVRTASAIEYEERNIILTEKSKLIDSVFEEAKKRITGLSGKEYYSFITEMLEEVIEQLHTDILTNAENDGDEYETSTDLELCLNEKDSAEFGKKLLTKAKKICGDLFAVSLSKTTADIPGGFILRRGAVEINCSTDLLVEQIRGSLESEISEILFSD